MVALLKRIDELGDPREIDIPYGQVLPLVEGIDQDDLEQGDRITIAQRATRVLRTGTMDTRSVLLIPSSRMFRVSFKNPVDAGRHRGRPQSIRGGTWTRNHLY